MERALHVGSGGQALPEWLSGFEEVRLDIDPTTHPHIVASMLDMGEIGEFDRVFSSHALEHVYPHEVQTALGEFLRVLKPGGAALVFVPDMQDVRPTEDVLYDSAAGPITGLDMFYGLRSMLKEQPYMAHHNAFTAETLRTAMEDAGFSRVEVKRVPIFNLFAVGVK